MWKGCNILLLLGCSCLLSGLALSLEGGVRVERMMPPGPGGPGGPGGPMKPLPPPPPMGSRKTPPLVDANYTFNCSLQREEYPHISCEEDGSFAELQCKGKRCFCVDSVTGDRVNSESYPERGKDSINCSAELECPYLVGCTRVCEGGYKLDRNCPTCRCQPPPRGVRCDSITSLIDEGCDCRCVDLEGGTSMGGPRTRMAASCPRCNEECDMDPSDSTNECLVTDPMECPNGTTLQYVGRRGHPQCVQDLLNTSQCMPAVGEEPGRRRPGPRGAGKRRRAGDLGRAMTPCGRGFVCRQVGFMEYQCVSEDARSPCVMARSADSNIDCQPDGSFRALQCSPVTNTTTTSDRSSRSRTGRTSSRGQMSCRCVYPSNGTTVEGSLVLLQEGERRPNCDRVYRDCEVPGLSHHRHGRGHRRRMYRVRHGNDYFDAANCRTCQCHNGDHTSFCTPMGNCSIIMPDNTTNNCTLEDGEVIVHLETTRVGCDVCGCRDGRVECTHVRDCEDEHNETDLCDMCRDEPISPVCGPDGRNHISRCTAIYCAGIPSVELQDGPCQSLNVCREYPCDEGEVCVRKGAVACLSTSGCKLDQLRTCVNITTLNCPAGNVTESTSEEDAVCGSDSETYSSLCELVQTTSNVHVAHTGPCEDQECQGGAVCGSDGVTYNNSCALESLSSTRVDYPGACVSGNSTEEVCMTVLMDGLCVVNSANCDRLVIPQDGCCPICGGTLSVAVDRIALSVVARSNPRLQTVDEFSSRMIDDEVFADVEGKCSIEANPTDTNDLQLTLTALADRYSDFCFRKSQEIADRVNTGELPADNSQSVATVTLPQVYEFAMAAVAAPLVRAEDGAESTTVFTETTTTGAESTTVFTETTTTGGCTIPYGSLTVTTVSLMVAAVLYVGW